MLSRLKQAISKTTQQQNEAIRKKSVDVSFLNQKDIEEYKRQLNEVKNNIEQVLEITISNKQDILAFISSQKQNNSAKGKVQNGKEQDQANYTLPEDIEEVKALLTDTILHLGKIQQTNQEIKDRAKNISGTESPEKAKQFQETIKKYESEIKTLQASDENYKQILMTLKQQTELLSKQTKNLQEKNMKLERQLSEKTHLLTNLQEQKTVLLQMRNVQSNSKNPEVQSLKIQLAESEKRIAIEKTKVQQKQKQIQTLKKKLEEDRDSLEKIADELKDKELKSKKIMDKYQRSKTEIRKYREEKTEFIKKLNIEIASLSEKAQRLEAQNADITEKYRLITEKNQTLEASITKNEGKGIDLESVKAELKLLRHEQLQTSAKVEEKDAENRTLRAQVDQLQAKRKSLLEALEKPINHEIRTLDKIIRALEKLYKEYIQVVFTQGNIIGFQNKISYILSNVCQIKQDLKL